MLGVSNPHAAELIAKPATTKLVTVRYDSGRRSATARPSVAAAAAPSVHDATSGERDHWLRPTPTSTGTTVATAAGIAISRNGVPGDWRESHHAPTNNMNTPRTVVASE